MKAPDSFIVKPKHKRYASKDIGGIVLETAASIEDARDVSREGIVVSLPLVYNGDVQVGDEVIIHHNVFREYYNQKGKLTDSRGYIYDNLFKVIPEEVFLYRQGGKWKAHEDWSYVLPIEKGENKIFDDIPQQHTGRVLLSNTHTPGDVIFFTPHSEYEMEIDGEKCYRMRDHDICVRIGNEW